MHIVIGLAIAFVIVALVARSRGTTRNCKWRRDKTGDKGNLRKFRCASCGEVAFSASDKTPNTCLQGKSGRAL